MNAKIGNIMKKTWNIKGGPNGNSRTVKHNIYTKNLLDTFDSIMEMRGERQWTQR